MNAEEWAAAVWQIGRGAFLTHLACGADTRVCAAQTGVSVPHDRSALAAESAEMLVNARGGDALERAEFARLFAIGEPQKGLRAFLDRRKGMSVAEKG